MKAILCKVLNAAMGIGRKIFNMNKNELVADALAKVSELGTVGAMKWLADAIEDEMKTIYLVLACWDYEVSSVTKAFEDEQDARNFVEECNQHKKKRPEYWDEERTGQSFEEWGKIYEEWASAHIASEYTTADIFIVGEISFVAKGEGK